MKKRKLKKRWLGAVAAVLAVAIFLGTFLHLGGGQTAYAITEAEYPEMAPYPIARRPKKAMLCKDQIDRHNNENKPLNSLRGCPQL